MANRYDRSPIAFHSTIPRAATVVFWLLVLCQGIGYALRRSKSDWTDRWRETVNKVGASRAALVHLDAA